MGGGSKRKEEDSPIIRRPKKAGTAGTGGGSGGSRNSREIGDVCIPSFEVMLETDIVTLKDTEVTSLRKNENVYDVIVRGKKVGETNKRITNMITTCIDMGVTYSGAVVKKRNKNEFLGRFIRK